MMIGAVDRSCDDDRSCGSVIGALMMCIGLRPRGREMRQSETEREIEEREKSENMRERERERV